MQCRIMTYYTYLLDEVAPLFTFRFIFWLASWITLRFGLYPDLCLCSHLYLPVSLEL